MDAEKAAEFLIDLAVNQELERLHESKKRD